MSENQEKKQRLEKAEKKQSCNFRIILSQHTMLCLKLPLLVTLINVIFAEHIELAAHQFRNAKLRSKHINATHLKEKLKLQQGMIFVLFLFFFSFNFY